MNNTKKIAVLLTVHNRKAKTISCLNHIFNAELPDGYLIKAFVTDDGCTDGTPDAIKNQYPQVEIIKGDGNLFWNRGMYTAWRKAIKENFNFYLWLNDDTTIIKDTFRILLSTSKAYHHNAIIIGATEDPDTHKFTYGGRYLDGSAIPPNGKNIEVDLGNGNIVLIPQNVVSKIGIIDPYYKHDKGDSDYTLTAKRHGIKVIQAAQYLGCCTRHENIPQWMNPNISIIKRLKAFHSVMGPQPKEIYYYEKKHFGIYKAIIKIITSYIRCIIPNLWIKIGKEKKLYNIKIKNE